jgi:hypothetical protein
VTLPSLRDDLARLGDALGWHGALSVDAIVEGPITSGARALIIDVNPRLVEPGNALAAGTDMVSALLAVATSTVPAALAPSRPGPRTHQLLMAILGAAQHSGRRRAVASEIAWALTQRGVYADSVEELQPLQGDWLAAVLPLAAAVATLARPSACRAFTDGAVQRYALSPEGWRRLCATPDLGALSPTAS